MRSRTPFPWRELLGLAGILVCAPPAAAQQARELGLQATVTASDPVLSVAGVYGALRMSARTRMSIGLGAGIAGGEAAARAELLGHFLLNPGQTRGAAFYFAGGLAAVAGPVPGSYLVITAGVEERPSGGSGWAVEAGVGGGFRVVAGYRWRWLKAP